MDEDRKHEAFFRYDEATDREWVEIDLKRHPPMSRAAIQDYAAGMGLSPRDWFVEAVVNWMKVCDAQGAHGVYDAKKPPQERKRTPLWRTRLADRLYGWADKIAGVTAE